MNSVVYNGKHTLGLWNFSGGECELLLKIIGEINSPGTETVKLMGPSLFSFIILIVFFLG